MCNQCDVYDMSTKLERTSKKDVRYVNSMDQIYDILGDRLPPGIVYLPVGQSRLYLQLFWS
jgi:hypothetical protein